LARSDNPYNDILSASAMRGPMLAGQNYRPMRLSSWNFSLVARGKNATGGLFLMCFKPSAARETEGKGEKINLQFRRERDEERTADDLFTMCPRCLRCAQASLQKLGKAFPRCFCLPTPLVQEIKLFSFSFKPDNQNNGPYQWLSVI